MTTPPLTPAVISLTLFLFTAVISVNSLSATTSTLAVISGDPTGPTICGIIAYQRTHNIICSQNNNTFNILPEISFTQISGGRNIFCGVRSAVGDNQVCGVVNGTRNFCWRGELPSEVTRFRKVSSGLGFSCGIRENFNSVLCWSSTRNGKYSNFSLYIQKEFANFSMLSIVVGGNFACGFNSSRVLICRGNNDNGELNIPGSGDEFRDVVLGRDFGCAIRRVNNTVMCWGGGFREGYRNVSDGVFFESIVAGEDFVCGLTSSNFSVICWGPGWGNVTNEVSLPAILPGPCVKEKCECGVYPLSETLCSGNGNICSRCDEGERVSPISPPPLRDDAPSSPSKEISKGLLAFAIVGCAGALFSVCALIYCLWTGACFGHKKIHSSVQPTINGTNSSAHHSNSSPPSRSSTIRRQSSRGWSRQRSGTGGLFGRQRSGTSGLFGRQRSGTSGKYAERAEEFLFSDLVAATNSFSLENKIGAGSFGVVYKGKLPDGREVAIKRGDTSTILKKFQEKESAFDSELAFLSRLHHKHLVRLVEPDHDYRPTKAAGTVGYIDPEYYGLNVLTAKSDVYGLGVVLLELLTGKRAIFKSDKDEGEPTSLVDFAVPVIMSGELMKILDLRVGLPQQNEAEAVELVGYTAMHCVSLEGKDRPTMMDIVSNLERALYLCEDSQGPMCEFYAPSPCGPMEEVKTVRGWKLEKETKLLESILRSAIKRKHFQRSSGREGIGKEEKTTV
ncbi:Serine/threonine-protein kinase-like protein [Heracleum sosnowskyi]|uniref:Serine/threonine-protein kinase-like protein n=1 Tax=Heracleum sosnowskyi TaxID=360622 RepID=A0AAD8M0K2_9APIA|nr:Serine/threonine-protein kinase-like protein [Heracleum sosnowskyi]